MQCPKYGTQGTVKRGHVLVDLMGLTTVATCDGRYYAMTFVGNFTRMNWVRFLARKNDSTAALRRPIADVANPASIAVGVIGTDEGGEFRGQFQEILNKLAISHEHTYLGMPQYNGVAEKGLEILKEKTVALLEDLTQREQQEAVGGGMSTACDLGNIFVATANKEVCRRSKSCMAFLLPRGVD